MNKRIKKKHRDYCYSNREINNEVVFNRAVSKYIFSDIDSKGYIRFRGILKYYNLHKRKTLFIGSSWKTRAKKFQS